MSIPMRSKGLVISDVLRAAFPKPGPGFRLAH